jgi:protein-S-isoprenylcysteine O-methyltransferase Ste14
MIALAWCLPCLFRHVLPYLYVIYFAMLLIDRERRDNEMCHAKYGADWETYQQKVRWRMLPGVY